jgi:hypothetical protein
MFLIVRTKRHRGPSGNAFPVGIAVNTGYPPVTEITK